MGKTDVKVRSFLRHLHVSVLQSEVVKQQRKVDFISLFKIPETQVMSRLSCFIFGHVLLKHVFKCFYLCTHRPWRQGASHLYSIVENTQWLSGLQNFQIICADRQFGCASSTVQNSNCIVWDPFWLEPVVCLMQPLQLSFRDLSSKHQLPGNQKFAFEMHWQFGVVSAVTAPQKGAKCSPDYSFFSLSHKPQQ